MLTFPNLGLGYKKFVNSNWPWFKRGYNFNIGSGAGVFTFVHDNGSANSNDSFREFTMLTNNLKKFYKKKKRK